MKISKPKQNDPKRFISTLNITSDGEVASDILYSLNQEVIEEESKYDGLYAVCTNLEDNVEDIIKINHRRWEIEESFRIMKNEFDARPVYLSREDRIKAHFMTCFLALTIYRFLEKKIDYNFTSSNIIETIRNMNLLRNDNDCFFPAYTRTDLTDILHDKFGFRTDYEVLTEKKLKKIFNQIKK